MLSPYLDKVKIKLPQLDRLYVDLFNGGKGVRADIVRDLSQCLSLDKKTADFLCEVVENIHHCSILHDDVIDESITRRNKKTAWVQFSRKKAILAGDYLLAQTSLILSQYGNLKLVHLTSTVVKNMVKGEWLQQEILGKETLESLDKIHILKTSSLFEWCLLAPFLCQQSTPIEFNEKLRIIALNMGRLFQRVDDAIDFGFNNKENKSILQDVREGYLNYFGVFLKNNCNIKNRDSLIQCQSKEDLDRLLGRENLDKCFNQFNTINTQLMDDSINQIDQLKAYLPKNQLSTIPTLKEWMYKLYLRN